ALRPVAQLGREVRPRFALAIGTMAGRALHGIDRLASLRICGPAQSNATLTDKISLKLNPAVMTVAKSYVNCTEDTSMPHDYRWHPELSQKLGLFRLIQVPGSYELCFSNPARLARALIDAGRD